MPSILLNKYTWYTVLIAAIIGIGWYKLNKWHYEPFKEHIEIIDILGTTVNNLEVNLTKCQADKTVSEFESFFQGGGGIETVNDANDNIFLKRMP